MRSVFLFLLILPRLALSNCVAKEEWSAPHMPAERNQQETSFCYAFSATAVIQQAWCASKGGCVAGEDLSVFDVLAIGNYGRGTLVAGGNEREVMEAVLRTGGVAPESCASFDDVMRQSKTWAARRLPKGARIPLFAPFRRVHEAFYEARDRGLPCKSHDFAKALTEMVPLAVTIDEVERALTYRNFQFFLREVVLPRKCESQRKVLPPLKVERRLSTQVGKAEDEVWDLLRGKQRPLALSLCAYGEGECGPHALVAWGRRELCCGSVCKRQIRIWDSSNAFQGRRSSDGWVDAGEVGRRMERFQGFLQKGGGAATDIISWLEPRRP